VKRDVVPYIPTPETSEAICRCQVIELCCHWHSLHRVINRRSGENYVPSVRGVLMYQGGIDRARMVLRMGLKKSSRSRQKSVGAILAVLPVSDLV
jgi:hypothetical protein